TKMMNWCFPDGNGTLREWGAIVGNWGGYDCSGLIGEASTPNGNDYAFFMNGAEQAGALVPLVRYDDRYARAVGKWVLNVANASRLFYTNYLPDAMQDSASWEHRYDPASSIAHEAMHQFSLGNGTISPFATGDAIRNGWAGTNFALYGASHAGILGGIIDTTNVKGILRLDLLKTDYFHAAAYPTFCYFNPGSSDTAVFISLGGGTFDLYNTVTKTYAALAVTGTVPVTIPANSASVLVVAPAGGAMTMDLDRTLINGVVVDYRNGYAGNHPPRIKSLSPDSSRIVHGGTINVYCAASDRDGDPLTYAWSSSGGSLSGTGSVVSYKAPDTPGVCVVSCTVSDGRGDSTSARDTLTVVASIARPPVILRMSALPRKVALGASSVVSCVVSNPDSSALTYSWSASAGSITGSGPAVTWHAPGAAANDVVRCSVDDAKGGHDADSLALEVRDLSVVQTGSLVAFYPFNGNANDATGRGHNGTVNGAVPVNDRFSHPSSAYLFDGSTASIAVPNDTSLNFQNAVTVNLWVKPAAFYAGREQYIISHGNWQNRWKLSVTPGTNRLRWTVKTSGGVTRDLDSSSPLVLDSLMDVTALYNGTDMEIYLNGALDAFTPLTGLINTTSYALTIAQDLPADNQYDFNGVLDDVRLYDYGLSLSEIAALDDVTGVAIPGAAAALPSLLRLYGNYPNPFNPTTTIAFAVPGAGGTRAVSLRVYDILGREVATLANGSFHGGVYTVIWDANSLSSGVYICRLESGGKSLVQKMILTK
ncbi:MAG TPA: LamG-like jellyroll fold domain-containing protein, partial [Bacteroidota bacterium]|nr:LamG-like jellyroll fold domain-containing protein [Bacteroidota bacterium]